MTESGRASALGLLPVLLWSAYVLLVLFLALGPFTVKTGVEHGDKVLHVLAFAGVALLFPWPVTLPRLWVAALVVVVLAAGIEIVQDFSPAYDRRPDRMDFLAGLAGGLTGLGLRLVLGRSRHAGSGA